MKTLFILFLFANLLYAKINAIVSIIPQKTFLQKIAGEKIDITVMVTQSNSPHTYSPKPSQMVNISKANIYFTIGVEFEKKWLDKFKSINSSMKIVDISKNIKKLHISKNEHHHEHETLDPHIWTSPKNVKIIAKNIYQELILLDNKNKYYYKKNYESFLQEIEETNTRLIKILDTKTKNSFIVFHPSWQYFANDYNLTQIAIQIDGKNAKAKHIISLLKDAKQLNINKIFSSPTFSNKMAIQIAKQLNIELKTLNALDEDWSNNLINFAKSIKE